MPQPINSEDFSSESSIVNTFISYAMNLKNEMTEQYEEREKEIFRRWEESKKLPRKAKKKLRKELQLDYSILQYGKKLFDFGL